MNDHPERPFVPRGIPVDTRRRPVPDELAGRKPFMASVAWD